MSNNLTSKSRGFTLVELVSTLAIGGTLIGTAVPGFQTLTAKNRMAVEVNSLVSHLYLTRSEAVKRVAPAVLCPSADGSNCLDQPDWHRGYILFSDTNNNGRHDPTEPLLNVRQSETTQITATSSVYRKRVTYRSDGVSGGSNVTITLCDKTRATPPQAVIVSNTGRPRVSDTQPDGTPLTCV